MVNRKGWDKSGLYTSKEACIRGADWWRNRGFTVQIKKVKGGWRHYRKPR